MGVPPLGNKRGFDFGRQAAWRYFLAPADCRLRINRAIRQSDASKRYFFPDKLQAFDDGAQRRQNKLALLV